MKELPEGTKVRYTHVRVFPDAFEMDGYHIDPEFLQDNGYTYWEAKSQEKELGWDGPSEFSPTGGATICKIWSGENVLAEGIAICSGKDHFSKKIGRQIAYGRAVKNLLQSG